MIVPCESTAVVRTAFTSWIATTDSPWPTPFGRVPTSPGVASGRLREQRCLPPRIKACGSPWPTPQKHVPTSPGRSQWPTPHNWVPTSPDLSLSPSMPQRNVLRPAPILPRRRPLRYQFSRVMAVGSLRGCDMNSAFHMQQLSACPQSCSFRARNGGSYNFLPKELRRLPTRPQLLTHMHIRKRVRFLNIICLAMTRRS